MYRHSILQEQCSHPDEPPQNQGHQIRRNLNSSYSGFRSTTFSRQLSEDRNQLLLEAELRLAQRDKRWFQSALAESNHKLEEAEREIKRLSACESELKAMETKFKSAEAEKTKVLDMVRKGVSEAEKAIEDERSRFYDRTKEYESKLKDALELGAEAKAEAKDLEEQLVAAREEIRSSALNVETEMNAKVETLSRNVCRLEEQLRVANDRIEFIMKENESKEKRVEDLESERDNLRRQLEEKKESFGVKLQSALKEEREKYDKIVSMLKRDVKVASMREEERKVENVPVVLEKKKQQTKIESSKLMHQTSAASTSVLDELNRKLSFLQDRNDSSRFRMTKTSTVDQVVDVKEVAETKLKREAPQYVKPRRTTEVSPPLDAVVTRKENWQSNLRSQKSGSSSNKSNTTSNVLRRSNKAEGLDHVTTRNIASRKQSNLRMPKRISKKTSVLSERQNRIRPSEQKRQMSKDMDPQKKALNRLRERRKRNQSKHVSPKVSKQEMIRRRREQEKKRHAKERLRLRRNEMRKQKTQHMQEQAENQMKSMLSETRVKIYQRHKVEDEDTRRNKAPPPPPPPLPLPQEISQPTIRVETLKENDINHEDNYRAGTSSDVETFLRESEESNRRVKMLRERREQLRGRLMSTTRSRHR